MPMSFLDILLALERVYNKFLNLLGKIKSLLFEKRDWAHKKAKGQVKLNKAAEAEFRTSLHLL